MANEEKKPVAPQTKGAAVKRTDKKLGFFKRVAKWFREMKSELKKVVWPNPSSSARTRWSRWSLWPPPLSCSGALTLWPRPLSKR